MRLLTAAGLLVFSAGTVFGAYVVELDGGDRMTVESYWEDGDRLHLMRGGVDLSVPKSRVKALKPTTSDDDTSGVGRPAAAPAPAVRRDPAPNVETDASHAELAAQRLRIERHQVRVSQEISMAQARGESPKKLKRLQREMNRTQARGVAVKRAMGDPGRAAE